MRQFYFLFLCFLTFGVLSAQEKLSKEEQARREKNIQAANPFAKFGYKAKIATLSKGKYLEVHDLDSIVTIGTVRYHVDKHQIVGNITIDTTDMYARPITDSPSRWLSPDPLSEEFPSWSPYSFVYDNPLRFVDPDGRAGQDWVKGSVGGQSQWFWRSDITTKQQALANGYTDYSNGKTNNTYTTSAGGKNQTVVLGENRAYTVNGASKRAPDSTPVDYEKFNAQVDMHIGGMMAAPSLPYAISWGGLEAFATKAFISITAQIGVNQDVDAADVFADSALIPGASGLFGGAVDFSFKNPSLQVYGFSNDKTGSEVLFNGASSLVPPALGSRFQSYMTNFGSQNLQKWTQNLFDANYSFIEQGINKKYDNSNP